MISREEFLRRSFANRVVLVTGAASGLGRQLARNLAKLGAVIAAIDLQAEPLAALAAELSPQQVAWAVADVTDLPALQQAVDKVRRQLRSIDLVIANAGIGSEISALKFQAAQVKAQVLVNLVGVANTIEAVLPEMLACGQGHLVAISSLASYRGFPLLAGYSASKAGVNALMDSLRLELKSKGVAVTTICPGFINTPMTDKLKLPTPNVMEVDVAARRIVYAIARRRTFYAFPWQTLWRVRLMGWLPCDWSDWILHKMMASMAKKQKRVNPLIGTMDDE